MPAPVPAGIRRPTMTFSLSPLSVSILPWTEASVSTRVVSWNEAAEMKLRVCSDALVMPSSTGLPSAFFCFFSSCALISSISSRSTCSPGKQGGVAAVGDLDLLQHLANDHLDVLVVDLHALESIDFLDLADEIFGQRLDAEHFEDVVRIG